MAHKWVRWLHNPCCLGVLKMKMIQVVLTQLVLLCPQFHTAKQNSLKLESTLAMCHSERLLHKSMHFAAKQQRPHQLTLKTKRQMHSMVHDVKIRTIEATDQQICSEAKNSKSKRAKSASDTLEWPGLSACKPINQKQIMNRQFRGKRNFFFSFPPTLPGSTKCAHGKASQRGANSQVAHKWARWLHNPCPLEGPHRFRAGGKIRGSPQVGKVAT